MKVLDFLKEKGIIEGDKTKFLIVFTGDKKSVDVGELIQEYHYRESQEMLPKAYLSGNSDGYNKLYNEEFVGEDKSNLKNVVGEVITIARLLDIDNEKNTIKTRTADQIFEEISREEYQNIESYFKVREDTAYKGKD